MDSTINNNTNGRVVESANIPDSREGARDEHSGGKAPRTRSSLKDSRRQDPLSRPAKSKMLGPKSAIRRREASETGSASGPADGGVLSTSAGPSRAMSPASSHMETGSEPPLPGDEMEISVAFSDEEGGSRSATNRSLREAHSSASLPTALEETKRKGRGKPRTTGDYVGLARAKADLIRVERDELDCRLETEVINTLKGAVGAFPIRGEGSIEELSTASLMDSIRKAAEAIEKAARVSKGLKGTMQKALKTAAATVRVTADELSARAFARASGTEEENVRRRSEELEKRIKELEGALRESRRENDLLKRTPPPQRELSPLPQRVTRARRRGIQSRVINSDSDTESGETGMGGRVAMPPPPSPLPMPPPLEMGTPREANREPNMEMDLLRKMEILMDAKLEAFRREIPAKNPEKGEKGNPGGTAGPDRGPTPGPTRAIAPAPSRSSRKSGETVKRGNGVKGGEKPPKGDPKKGGKEKSPKPIKVVEAGRKEQGGMREATPAPRLPRPAHRESPCLLRRARRLGSRWWGEERRRGHRRARLKRNPLPPRHHPRMGR